jgi:hypothetical protein
MITYEPRDTTQDHGHFPGVPIPDYITNALESTYRDRTAAFVQLARDEPEAVSFVRQAKIYARRVGKVFRFEFVERDGQEVIKFFLADKRAYRRLSVDGLAKKGKS